MRLGTGTTTSITSAVDGAILDGVSSSIKATVLDYANSNPLAVRLTDTSGDYVATFAVTQSGTWDEVGINDSGNSITVDATNLDIRDLTNLDVVTAELSAIDNAVLDAIAASVAAIDTDTSTLLTTAAHDAAFGTAGTADTQVRSIQGIASMTPVQVSQATASNLNATVVGTGTFAVQDATAEASLSVLDDWDNGASDGASVSGDVAHDTVDAGEPIKIGFKAFSPDGTTPGTAVAENDRTNGKSDLDGRLFINGEHPRWWSFHSDGSTALTDESVAADPGDGFQVVITEIVFSTGAATAANIFFEEGSTKILGPWYLEAVAGRGLIWKGKKHVTASTAVTVTTSASIAHSVDVQGYIQAV